MNEVLLILGVMAKDFTHNGKRASYSLYLLIPLLQLNCLLKWKWHLLLILNLFINLPLKHLFNKELIPFQINTYPSNKSYSLSNLKKSDHSNSNNLNLKSKRLLNNQISHLHNSKLKLQLWQYQNQLNQIVYQHV